MTGGHRDATVEARAAAEWIGRLASVAVRGGITPRIMRCVAGRSPGRQMDDGVDAVKLTDVVDAAQAAAMLGVTRQHVVHLFQTQRLPGKRLTATWVTTRQAVETYARTRRAPGRPRTREMHNS